MRGGGANRPERGFARFRGWPGADVTVRTQDISWGASRGTGGCDDSFLINLRRKGVAPFQGKTRPTTRRSGSRRTEQPKGFALRPVWGRDGPCVAVTPPAEPAADGDRYRPIVDWPRNRHPPSVLIPGCCHRLVLDRVHRDGEPATERARHRHPGRSGPPPRTTIAPDDRALPGHGPGRVPDGRHRPAHAVPVPTRPPRPATAHPREGVARGELGSAHAWSISGPGAQPKGRSGRPTFVGGGVGVGKGLARTVW